MWRLRRRRGCGKKKERKERGGVCGRGRRVRRSGEEEEEEGAVCVVPSSPPSPFLPSSLCEVLMKTISEEDVRFITQDQHIETDKMKKVGNQTQA